ncbi:MAG TPA: GNAT family N-acyltransferase [Bryobacteraceae bacterium]|nr:GNAT family N-acyltransferase [Bryobacteraceae bacterium]
MQDVIDALVGPKLLQRLLVLDRFQSFFEKMRHDGGSRPVLERTLTALNVQPRISTRDLGLVPKHGPVVAVANHPFGLMEGAILATLLRSVRPDVKILANHWLRNLPGTEEHCIFVDPFGGPDAVRSNRKSLKESIAWLERGGMLALFPAGEVAHLNLLEGGVRDPEWNQSVARIIRMTHASVLPVYFPGANSAWFQVLGFLHPKVRTALLAHEFLNKANRRIEVRIGNPIAPAKLRTYQDDVAMTRYLRHRTYLLDDRKTPSAAPKARYEQVAQLVMPELIAADIARLGADRTLVESGELTVLLARAAEIPNGLREIGRLRELTFREIGEGTGKSIDRDAFDDHYWHLFVWNKRQSEIVGAYRLGPSDEILPRAGVKGLYTSSLFHWNEGFLKRTGPALELGRSFVRAEYQKSYAPLLLLWKGIGKFLVRNPKYRVLFGPVSISNKYTVAARELMVTYLSAFRRSPELAPLVRARNPFRQRPSRLAKELVGGTAWDMEELSTMVADVEADHKGMPVLLRQYLKLGGELVAFNVDRKFSNALDGLIVVDLAKTDPRLLERYLGKEGAAIFGTTGRERAYPHA